MIGDPLLSPEERAYRDQASEAISALIPPDLPERMDRNEILYPKEYLREMAKRRYLGVPVPAGQKRFIDGAQSVALRALQIAANYAEHRKTFGKRLRGARPSRDPMPERAAQKV